MKFSLGNRKTPTTRNSPLRNMMIINSTESMTRKIPERCTIQRLSTEIKPPILEEQDTKRNIKYSFITSANIENSEYWQTLKQGVDESVQIMNNTITNYQFKYSTASNELDRVRQQITYLEEALKENVTIVATTCVLGDNETTDEAKSLGKILISKIRDLLDNGITVMTVDTSEITDDRLETFFGPKADDLGIKLAKEAKKLNCIKCVIFVVTPQWGALRKKVEGIRSVYPDAEVLGIEESWSEDDIQDNIFQKLSNMQADTTTAMMFVQLNGLEAGIKARNRYSTISGQKPNIFVTDRSHTTDTHSSDIEYAIGFNQYHMGAQPLQWGLLSYLLHSGSKKPWRGGNDSSWSVSLTTATQTQKLFSKSAGSWGALLGDVTTVNVGLSEGWLSNISDLSDDAYNNLFKQEHLEGWSWVQRNMLSSEILDQRDTELCFAYAIINIISYASIRSNRGTDGTVVLHPLKIGEGTTSPFPSTLTSHDLRFLNYYKSTGIRNVLYNSGTSGDFVTIKNNTLASNSLFAWIRSEADANNFPKYHPDNNGVYNFVTTGITTQNTRILHVSKLLTDLNGQTIVTQSKKWMHLLSYGPLILKITAYGVNKFNNFYNVSNYKIDTPAYGQLQHYLYSPTPTTLTTEVSYRVTVIINDSEATFFNYTSTFHGWSVKIGNNPLFFSKTITRGQYHYESYNGKVNSSRGYATTFDIRANETEYYTNWGVGETIYLSGNNKTFNGTIVTKNMITAKGGAYYSNFSEPDINTVTRITPIPIYDRFGHSVCATGVLWYKHPGYQNQVRPFLKIKNSWGSSWGTDENGLKNNSGQNGYLLVDMWALDRGYGPLDMYAGGCYTLQDNTSGGFNEVPIAPSEKKIEYGNNAMIVSHNTNSLDVRFELQKRLETPEFSSRLNALQYRINGLTDWKDINVSSVIHLSNNIIYKVVINNTINLIPIDKYKQTYSIELRMYDKLFNNITQFSTKAANFEVVNNNFTTVNPPKISNAELSLRTPPYKSNERHKYVIEFTINTVHSAKTVNYYKYEIMSNDKTIHTGTVTVHNSALNLIQQRITLTDDEGISIYENNFIPQNEIPDAIKRIGGPNMKVINMHAPYLNVRTKAVFTNNSETDWSQSQTTTNVIRSPDGNSLEGGYLNHYYDNNYEINEDKWWKIEGTTVTEFSRDFGRWIHAKSGVRVQLTNFDTENWYDFVSVYGKYGNLQYGGKSMFSGSLKNFYIDGFSDSADFTPYYIRFLSDYSVTRKGFAMKYYTKLIR